MKTLLSALLMILCMAQYVYADDLYVVDKTVNVRSQADAKSKILGKLKQGDTISVASTDGEWAAIDYDGKSGYVNTGFITAVPEEEPVKEEHSGWGGVILFVLVAIGVYLLYRYVRQKIRNFTNRLATYQKNLEKLQEAKLSRNTSAQTPVHQPQQNLTRVASSLSDTAEQRAYAAKFEAVDLGLPSGLKWANMNIGAENPKQPGDYYAWGEVEAKRRFFWTSYKYCSGPRRCTKYVPDVDNKKVLDKDDDVAHVKMGGKWRMPRIEDFEELRSKCEWIKTDEGFVVKGPNGNSIFIPAAGGQNGTSLNYSGFSGYYWSASLNLAKPAEACQLFYFDTIVNTNLSSERYAGKNVRPVCG